MPSELANLSIELATLVEHFQPHVVAVHARGRFNSSGVQWRPGVIVTADHAIGREEDIQITVAQGKRLNAILAGRDTGSDIAVLKAEGLDSKSSPTASAQPAKVGELVLVLGRSADSGPNASLGVISAVSGPWRTWRGGQLDQYIRLDATLFPQSSGGAVVDCRGQLLGVATSGLSRIAGLAIPVTSINRVVDLLLKKGRVPRGYLGIGAQPVTIPDTQRSALSLTNRSGIIVVNIEPGGPAEKAGLMLGDILVRLGDSAVEQIEDLQSFSDLGLIGKPVMARVIRAGALTEIAIIIGERPGK